MAEAEDRGKQQQDADQAPEYVIEGARSGRSKCKTCRRKIDKGGLRLGVLIEGPFGTGYLWHHLKCAARRMPDRVEEAYEARAWNNAANPPTDLPSLDDLRKERVEADERRRKRKTIPYAEVSPTGRARCKHCGEPLPEGELRIVLGKLVEFGSQSRVAPHAVHASCAALALEEPDCATEAEDLAASLRENSGELPTGMLESALEKITADD
jgi:hypothetical protein